VGLTGKDLHDPIGEETWGETRLLLPDGGPGAMYQNLLTFQFVTATAAEQGAALPMAEVFAHLPVALLHRVT